MDKSNFDIGMYIIDKDYRIVNCNENMKEMYPEVKVGDICHKSLALSDTPCATCPLVNNDVLFYNPFRKEWITANAAIMDYPGHGECYNIQFRMDKNVDGSQAKVIPIENIDEHLLDLKAFNGNECIIGAYTDSNSPIFYANDNMVKFLGFETIQEMFEYTDGLVANIIHPNDRERVKKNLPHLKNIGDTFETMFRVLRKDGSWPWVVVSGKLIQAENGQSATISVYSNMENLLKLHDALQEDNKKLLKTKAQAETVFNSIPGGYHQCRADEKYSFIHISESFEKVVGWTKKEIEKEFDNKFLNMVLPEDLHLFGNLLEQIEDRGQGSSIYRIKGKNGEFKWVQDSTMYVDLGKESFYQCTLADITEFIKNQEKLAISNIELQKREDLFDAIAKNMPSGYHRCGTGDGFPLFFISDSFLEIIGVTDDELKTIFDNKYINIVAPEDREFFMAHEEELVKNGRVDVVYRILHKDGTRRWVKDSTVRVTQGKEEFFQCTLADITEFVTQLNLEKEKAEASNRAKSAFLFNASHDIRTPMNAIQGFTQVLKANIHNEQVVMDTITKIEKSGDMLMKLLNNVLELSRIESGKETLELIPTNLDEFVDKLKTMMVGEIESLGINFKQNISISNNFVICDELKLTQVAMNMISNAKKFTSNGGTITLGIDQTEEERDGYAVFKFYVRDTGIGMSKEFLSRAFEQFERERTTTESGIIGSGLGLSIIKKLTELMGGTCGLESEVGKGTEISATIKLPIAKEVKKDNEKKVIQSIDFSNKRILLVEDNDFNREIARFVLENIGIQVEEAENGAIAVDIVQKSQVGYFDVVLMDIQMPVMNGYEATERIRQIENSELSSIPIVALTANAFVEDKQKCLDVGMNAHIGKPIDTNELIEVLSSVLSK